MDYAGIQAIAKETICRIKADVRPGMTLREVRERCQKYLLELGADSFWYYNVGALVFRGDQTALSASGRTYQTPDCVLQENDILTIDLSPQGEGLWGDYARTIILQDGRAVESMDEIRNEEWKNGLLMEEKLHAELLRVAVPDMTYEALSEHMNAFIKAHGYVNLDFKGNLGHSIEKHSDDRLYIEKGNQRKLGDTKLFTFEPHISLPGSCYGFKKENIYFFENGKLKEL